MGERRVENDLVARVGRIVLGALWLGGTLWGAAVCFSIGLLDTATFFGEPSTEELRREGLLSSLAGALIAAFGPLGLWFVSHRRAWLLLAMALGSLGVGFAIYVVLYV